MNRSVLLALLIAPGFLAAPAAVAQEEPAGPAGTDVEWVVSLKEREIGREQVHVETREGRRRITSSAELSLTATPFRFRQELELEADTGAVVSYTLTSDMIRSQARRTADGLTIAVAVAGQHVERPVTGDAPVVVLDNLVFAHYAEVGRLAAARGGFTCTAVVPQSAAAIGARFVPGDAGVGTLAGAERKVRKGQLTLANVLVELWYDPESGAVYAVDVPGQALAAHVVGFEPPAPPSTGPAEQLGRELEVEVPAPGPGLAPLGGVLTLPATGEGPWPTVLFLAGSGPQDRDETIGPNKPFRDLAHLLAGAGVASLRTDKRTLQLGQALRGGDEEAAAARQRILTTTLKEEYVDDAVAALGWLAARPEVDGLVVLGHSLGGLALSAVGRAWGGDPPVVAWVMLSSAGRPLDVLMREQMIYQAGLRGMDEEAATTAIDRQLAPLAVIRAGGDPGVAMVFGASAAYWRDIFARDPVAEAASLKGPVLLIQGEADCQVRMTDFDLLRKALAGRPEGSLAAKPFPGLNHLLMKVDGESTGAEYSIPSHVAPEVGEAIASWVRQQVRAARAGAAGQK